MISLTVAADGPGNLNAQSSAPSGSAMKPSSDIVAWMKNLPAIASFLLLLRFDPLPDVETARRRKLHWSRQTLPAVSALRPEPGDYPLIAVLRVDAGRSALSGWLRNVSRRVHEPPVLLRPALCRG